MTKTNNRKTFVKAPEAVISPPDAREPALAQEQPRAGSKQALVVELLSRPDGATLPDRSPRRVGYPTPPARL